MIKINVAFEDGHVETCMPYTTVGSLAGRAVSPAGFPYIAALVNNEVSSLSYPLTADSHLEFLTVADSHGWRVYRNSLSFILAKAVAELFPEARFSVAHSFGTGIYCRFEQGSSGHLSGVSEQQLRDIETRMRQLVGRDLPIKRRKLSFTRAVAHFEKSGQVHKLNLLRFRNPPRIVVHDCDGFSDLAHSPLASATGVLKVFSLIPYPPGFVLQLPDREDPSTVAAFEDQRQLFEIYQEHKEWGRILNVSTVGRLNEIIQNGQIAEFIRISEALHEKKAAAIADEVLSRGNSTRLILVAGPSCAGKTTFSKRLSVQLRVNGLRPVSIGTDDYFVSEEDTPKDEHGNYDFEHIEAVDIDLFNDHLVRLLGGEEVLLPSYDFETRTRMPGHRSLRLADDQLLIVEGIHGLNPRLTHMVPADAKFSVYVSALTQLALDTNNRVSTTDNRLMRRLIRDSKFRGNTPLTTLRMWPSVRRGEKKWIFPFQKEAGATFNSALDYELAVLKPLVEPLLLRIKPSHVEYAEARRLAAFLSNFLGVSDQEVPRTSILREYIGESGFHY